MDGLQLNINFQEDAPAGPHHQQHHQKLDWRERKRQAQQRRVNKRQGGSQPPAVDRRIATPTGHRPPPAAATTTAAAAAQQPAAKRQKLVQQQRQQTRVVADPLHGYGAALQQSGQATSPAPQRQQQQGDGRPPRADASSKPSSRAVAAAAPSVAKQQQQQQKKPLVVKGAVAKMQDAAESAGVSPDEEQDILALVTAHASREAQLAQELQQQGRHASANGAGEDSLPPGVVEFGEAEDEPDYAALLSRKQQQQQQGAGRSGASGGSSGKQQPGGSAGQKQKAQLVQHKTGDMTHAEPNVPAASRLQLFGPESVPGVADDSSWAGLGLSSVLSAHLEALNFQEPTQVQKQTIPVLLSGRDALVRSPTGSGKTLAYLGPLVHSLQAASPRITREQGTHAVVLVPTRELAVQVNDVLTALLRRFCWLVPGILIGGEHRGHEKARLRKGVTVLVATPGRLMDHLENTTCFKTDQLSWLVLDEADRLLDLGFEQKLAAIIAAFDARSSSSGQDDGQQQQQPRSRRTVLLSATLHPGLSSLAGLSLQAAVAVGFKTQIVDGQLTLAAPEGAAEQQQQQQQQANGTANGSGAFELPQQLTQKFVEVPAKMRLVYLIGVLQSRLRRSKASKLVVFFSNCDSVDFHHTLFSSAVQLGGGPGGAAAEPAALLGGAPVCKLHGDMLQPERTSALVTFSKAKSCVLLCTDVAARGLDFPAVSTIIQYDPAGDPAEYVHRVGRTARMGQHGEALLFLLPSELVYVELLQQRGMQLQQEKASDLLRTLPLLLSSGGGGGANAHSRSSSGVLKLARKLQQESAQESGGGGGGGKCSSSEQPGAGGSLSAARAEQMAAALLLQRQLLLAISGDQELRQMALNAFRSFVRAYATHPTSLKHVFHVKSLHLGHLAASFGLKEAPGRIGSSGAAAERKKRKADDHRASQKRQKAAWHKTARAAAADGA